MSLILLARATQLVPNFPASDNAVMQDIVDASSDLVVRYTGRDFALTSYDELYDGTGYSSLLLNQYPVVSITRISQIGSSVFAIRNTDTDVSHAEFRLTTTSLILTSSKNGSTTTRTVTLATTPTLSDLETAVNAFSADGWASNAVEPFSSLATADLRAPQGGFTGRIGNSYLHNWFHDLTFYRQNPDTGEVHNPCGWVRGYQNYRVIYSAGYSTVPPPIQQAIAELAVATYYARNQNVNLQSESLGEYSYTLAAEKTFKSLSITALNALSLYRNHRVAKWKVY